MSIEIHHDLAAPQVAGDPAAPRAKRRVLQEMASVKAVFGVKTHDKCCHRSADRELVYNSYSHSEED